MAMVHTGLLPYYETIFALTHHHGWSIDDIENLIPWELEVLTTLLSNYIDTVETHRKNASFARNGR